MPSTSKTAPPENALLQAMLDHIPVMVIIMELSSGKVTVNRYFETILGHSGDEGLHEDFIKGLFPLPAKRQLPHGRAALEWEFTSAAGAPVLTSWSAIRVSENIMLGIGTDPGGHNPARTVTKGEPMPGMKDMAEEALRRSEEHFRRITENAPDMI
jgi:PAS domain-containing protein